MEHYQGRALKIVISFRKEYIEDTPNTKCFFFFFFFLLKVLDRKIKTCKLNLKISMLKLPQ